MMKVLHFLSSHLPLQAGYTIRSEAVVANQAKLGIEPVIFTLPDFNHSLGYKLRARETAGGIVMYNWVRPAGNLKAKIIGKVPFFRNIYDFRVKIRYYLKLSEEVRPEIVHSHSPALCAIYGDLIARKNNTPFIYEVRGIWEDTAVAEGKMTEDSMEYRNRQYAETVSSAKCHALVTISEGLKRDFVSRGTPEDKIFVVPNGVDTNRFSPHPALADFKVRLHLQDKIIIGYIGAVRRLEGLELAVKSMPAILNSIPNAALIIVGGGNEKPNLLSFAEKSGLKDKSIFFYDEVPHEDILGFHTAIDVFILPRQDKRVSRLVTPLKPLEAMSMGKPVLGSDVGGIKELVENNTTGMLFKADNGPSFVEQCLILLRNADLRKTLGANAREWVVKERNWNKLVAKYIPIYDYAIKTRMKMKL